MISFDFDIQERMNIQRKVLKKINSKCQFRSDLSGLSSSAIETWEKVNQNIPIELIQNLKEFSCCLLILSTRSQESIDIREVNTKNLNVILRKIDTLLQNI